VKVTLINNTHVESLILTIGKEYELLEVLTEKELINGEYDLRGCIIINSDNITFYKVVNNLGEEKYYDGWRFSPNPLSLNRNDKLKQILNKVGCPSD